MEPVPPRVGYLLNQIVNGLLGVGEIGKEPVITLRTDVNLDPESWKNISILAKEYKVDRDTLPEESKGRYKLGSYLLSSLNEVFILTSLFPGQPWSKYIATVHPDLIALAALNSIATLICMMKSDWKVSTRNNLYYDITGKYMSVPAIEILEKEKNPRQVNLLNLCRANNIFLSSYNMHELHSDLGNIPNPDLCTLSMADLSMVSLKEYIRIIKAYPIAVSDFTNITTVSEETTRLKETTDLVDDCYTKKSAKMANYEYYIALCRRLRKTTGEAKANSISAIISIPVVEALLPDLPRRLTLRLRSLNKSVLGETEKYMVPVEKKYLSEDRLHEPLKAYFEEKVPTFPDLPEQVLHELEKLLEDIISSMYNSAAEFSEWIKRTMEIEIDTVVKEFFKTKELFKFAGFQGNIRGIKGVGALLVYTFRVIQIEPVTNTMSTEEMSVIDSIRTRLNKMLSELETKPVQAIIRQFYPAFQDALYMVQQKAKPEVQALIDNLNLCQTYHQAWSVLLRLKGVLYECFFALDKDLAYEPEDRKQNLTSIIRHNFPERYDLFIARTEDNSFVRELKPDFYIADNLVLEKLMLDPHRPKGGHIPIVSIKEEKEETDEWTEYNEEFYRQSEEDEGPTVREAAKGKIWYEGDKKVDWDETDPEEWSDVKAPESLDEKESSLALSEVTGIGKLTGEDYVKYEIVRGVESRLMSLLRNADKKRCKGGFINQVGMVYHINPEMKVTTAGEGNENQSVVTDEDGDMNSEIIEDEEMTTGETEVVKMWGDVKLGRPDPEVKYRLLITEVGYQTDQEGKIRSDVGKWSIPLQILRSIGIAASCMVAVDTTSQAVNTWWISERFVKVLKASVAGMFGQLTKYTPIDVSERIVGDISSQELRSTIRAGTVIKPPVLYDDLYKFYHQGGCKSRIQERVLTTIPEEVMESVEKALVSGCVLNTSVEKRCVERIISTLTDLTTADKICDIIDKGEVGIEKLTEKVSSNSFLEGWLLEDLKHRFAPRCQILAEIKRKLIGFKRTGYSIGELVTKMNYDCKCKYCDAKIITDPTINQRIKPGYQMRIPAIGKLTSHMNQREEKQTGTNDDQTELDLVVAMSLPGKTQKEKNLKNLVRTVIQLTMVVNDIPAIKDSKGQIYLNPNFKRISKSLMISSDNYSLKGSRIRKLLEEDNRTDASKGEFQEKEPVFEETRTISSKSRIAHASKRLNELSSKVLQASTNCSKTQRNKIGNLLNNYDKQGLSRCAFSVEAALGILKSMKLDNDAPSFLRKVVVNESEKASQGPVKDDSLQPVSTDSIEKYFESQRHLLRFKSPESTLFSSDCFIFDEVIQEVRKRYKDEINSFLVDYIEAATRTLLSFGYFQHFVLYAKVCQSFLSCCSEFTHSGLRIITVPHTDMNLVVKIPQRKSANMTCCLLNLKMEPLTEEFFLNRRQAVIGQSFPYCILVLYVQTLQTFRCIQDLKTVEMENNSLFDTEMLSAYEHAKSVIMKANKGDFSRLSSAMPLFPISKLNPKLNSQMEILVRVTVGFSVTMGLLLGPTMLLNSQGQNKQLQTIRYPYMLSLSNYGFPTELGKKMSASSRRVETWVSRLYLQVCSYVSMRTPDYNRENWKLDDHLPNTNILCITCYGCSMPSDRQFLNCIYLVHLYNKELDNFDEGCIDVLEEFADRHMKWEESLRDAVNLTKLESKKMKKEGMRKMRLLLGVPELKGRPDQHDPEDIEDKQLTAESQNSSSNSEKRSTGSSSRLSAKSRAPRFRKVKEEEVSLITSVTGRTFTMSSASELAIEGDEEGRLILLPKTNRLKYSPSMNRIRDDVFEICTEVPKHTYGSFECIQAATEFAKTTFNLGAIDKARKSKRNWTSISTVAESTSIIKLPVSEFKLSTTLEQIKKDQARKMVKLLGNRIDGFQETDTMTKADLYSSLGELLTGATGVLSSEKELIMMAVKSTTKLDYENWKDILDRDINYSLLSADANKLYYWVKSLANEMKVRLKNELKRTNVPERDNYRLVFKSMLDGERYEGIGVLEEMSAEVDFYTDWVTIFEQEVQKLCQTSAKQYLMDACSEKLKSDFKSLDSRFNIVKNLKNKYPEANFAKEESTVRMEEAEFLVNNGKELMKVFNLMLILAETNPWINSANPTEIFTLNRFMVDIQASELTEDGSLERKHTALRQILNYEHIMSNLFSIEESADRQFITSISRYLNAMFIGYDKPFSKLISFNAKKFSRGAEEVMVAAKAVLMDMSLKQGSEEFILTVNTMKHSNFNTVRKLLGRGQGTNLPRSIRSKVIYEVINLVQTSGRVILQQNAFSTILDEFHRSFATLAPKAQLGGNRDLLVQEVGTKLINATSECFAKSMLDNVANDGLVNQQLKEQILTRSLESKQLSHKLHGQPQKDKDGTPTGLKVFRKTLCVSGDRTKWGPIHCTSFFSAMYQQLLTEVDDWDNFEMLVMLKGLDKMVEIPLASLKKILNQFLNSEDYARYKKLSQKSGCEKLEEVFRRHAEIWEWKPYVKFLIDNYLSTGKMAMRSYNHMGQGIHHATSSLLANIAKRFSGYLFTKFFQDAMPKVTVSVDRASSSDDYLDVQNFEAPVHERDMESFEALFDKTYMRATNFETGIARCLQMLISTKTVISDTVGEFYSEFDMFHRISPSVVKFVISSIINSSVTTPLTLYQSTHVCCQQAMYQSTPLLTNLMFAICRQQIYFNHAEKLIRMVGEIIFNLPSSFGRLYVPEYSVMISSGQFISDVESIIGTLFQFKHIKPHTPVVSEELEKKLREMEGIWDEEGHVLNYQKRLLEDFSGFVNPNLESKDILDTIPSVSSSFVSIEGDDDESSERAEEKADDEPNNEEQRAEFLRLKTELGKDKSTSGSAAEADGGDDLKGMAKNRCVHSVSRYRTDRFIEDNLDLNDGSDYEYLRTFAGQEKVLVGGKEYNRALILSYIKKIVTLIVCRFYDSFAAEGIEQEKKADYGKKEQAAMEDPFVIPFAESVRLELSRLNIIKGVANELIADEDNYTDPIKQIARSLITSNCATEDTLGESSRLSQIIRSPNILNSLSGGIKSLSLPIYNSVLKAYFFIDKAGLIEDDVWATTVDPNIVDRKLSPVPGKTKVKFLEWIRRAMNVKLLRSSEERANATVGSLSLVFEGKELISSPVKTDSDGRKVIVANFDTIEKLAEAMTALTSQLTDHNRSVLRGIETNPVRSIFEASRLIIEKSKVFTRSSSFRTDNQAAIIMAYALDDHCIADSKPVGVRSASLDIDKSSLLSFFVVVNNTIARIKKEGDRAEVKASVKILNGLARIISQGTLSITSFYTPRPAQQKSEDSLLNLCSYGTIEGQVIGVRDREVHTSAFSEKYFKILEAIGAIGNLPIESSEKTTILMRFLNWAPAYSERLLINGSVCSMSNEEEETIKTFQSATIAVQLMTEAGGIRRESRQKKMTAIAQFSLNQKDLLKDIIQTDLQTIFKTRGEPFTSGKFELSCQFGTATGLFIDGKLMLSMTVQNIKLLRLIERKVLAWCDGLRTDALTYSQHGTFINHLMTDEQARDLRLDTQIRTVELTRELDEPVRIIPHKRGSKVIIIRDGLLTSRSYKPDLAPQSPAVSWNRGNFSFYVSQEVSNIIQGSGQDLVVQVLKELDPNTADRYRKRETLQEQRSIIQTIDLPRTMSRASFLLFHRFLQHSYTRIESLTLNSTRFRELSKPLAIQEGMRKLMADKVLKASAHVLCEPRDYAKTIVGERLKRELESRNLIRLDMNPKFGVENAKRMESLAEDYGLDMSELERAVDDMQYQTEGSKIEKLQRAVNSYMKDATSWPLIQEILNILRLDNVEIIPHLKTGYGIDWQLVQENPSDEVKSSRNIFEQILLIKSGTVPIQFAISAASMSDPIELFTFARRTAQFISNSKFTYNRLNNALALYVSLFHWKIRTEESKMSWTSFLGTLYPVAVKLSLTHWLQVRLENGVLAWRVVMNLSHPEYLGLRTESAKKVDMELKVAISEAKKLGIKLNDSDIQEQRVKREIRVLTEAVLRRKLWPFRRFIRLEEKSRPDYKHQNEPTGEGLATSYYIDAIELEKEHGPLSILAASLNESQEDLIPILGLFSSMMSFFFGCETPDNTEEYLAKYLIDVEESVGERAETISRRKFLPLDLQHMPALDDMDTFQPDEASQSALDIEMQYSLLDSEFNE